MIVYEGPGDIMDAGECTLVCPVNAVGVMGKGLAKTMKEAFPGLLARYRAHYGPVRALARDGSPLYLHQAKELTLVPVGYHQSVLLFPTKYHWRDPSPAALVHDNLVTLSKRWDALGITALAMPMVGTGLGGLPRPLVKRWIHDYLGPIDLPVSLYC